jgi:Bromodomain
MNDNDNDDNDGSSSNKNPTTTNTETSTIITPTLTNSQKEAMNRMIKMVQQFLVMKESEPFREPVNWKELELFDYPKIVKHPMDLGTIQNHIDRNDKYTYAAEIAYDMKLIWKNCMLYNAEKSDFHFLAKMYSKRFEDRYRRIRNECKYYKQMKV